MKHFNCHFMLLLLIAGWLTACNQSQLDRSNTTETLTSTSLQSTFKANPTLFRSHTPKPTLSPVPSKTISPTPLPFFSPTPTDLPTKDIFILYADLGGDGGYLEDYYMGRGTPQLVIYTDGQLLYSRHPNDRWFKEVLLTSIEMCQIRSQIQATGFLDLDVPPLEEDNPKNNPIYKLDDTAQISKGASNIVIQVNGEINQTVYIYTPLLDFLIPEVDQARQLLEKYQPPVSANLYQPDWALLWIEKGHGELGENLEPSMWPTTLPKLSELWEKRIETTGVFGAEVVVLQGDLKDKILELFQYQMIHKVFMEDDLEYYLILRPLLPHETITKIFPWVVNQSIELPFTCNN